MKNHVDQKKCTTFVYEADDVVYKNMQQAHFYSKARDAHLEFPGGANLVAVGTMMSSGSAVHGARGSLGAVYSSTQNAIERGAYTANNLDLFREDDWAFECLSVLQAHGWLDRTASLNQTIIDKVAECFGASVIKDAVTKFGENSDVYIESFASRLLAEPLSRLWYVNNMREQFYLKHDDMKVGILWAEYKIRLSQEHNALRGERVKLNASAGGKAAGTLAEESRREILTRMRCYIGDGHSVMNAARLTKQAGLGTSAEANRKLWSRHRK